MRTPPRSLVRASRFGGLLSVALTSTLLGSACGGGRDGAAGGDAGGTVAGSGAPALSAPSGSTAQPASGRTVDVQMVGDATGYRFVPATVTIKAGDTVRWTNASGGPHNVTFWSDSIPAGATTRLQASMPQTTSPLTGPLLTTPNATYAISFAGAPAGTYAYYCTPHLALGMKAKVVVE
ncbi:MAG: plastocyanin/azurin family copper-binding protein [Gemmatimonadaceae bacterium]